MTAIQASDFPRGVVALQRAMQNSRLSAVEATEYYLHRIAARDGKLNSFISVTDELALRLARESDQRRAANRSLGALDGIPVAFKDNIDVAGVATSAGIEARRHQIADCDATVVALLRAAGAVVLGKTNLHEAALGATTDNPHFGQCHNPHRHGFTPGGSSGGSGAAVAAGLCAAALGTDTLGSVRIPAAYCGCYGFKASSGVISNHGVVPLSWTLDHVGPLVPCVEDLWPLLALLAKFDWRDPNSWASGQRFVAGEPDPAIFSGLRVGRIANLTDTVDISTDIAAALDQVCDTLQAHGAELKAVGFENYDFSRMRRAGLLISEAEASTVHGPGIAANPAGYSEVLRSMLDWGGRQGARRLAEAYRAVNGVKVWARRLFSEIDVLVLPTAPQTAFSFAEQGPLNQADLTGFANLAQCPALSAPMGLDGAGLPMGLQIVAPLGEDERVLRVAAAYSAAR